MPQEMTGYPSIDKPWLKYYSQEAINTPITEFSVYEYLVENDQDNLDRVALVYNGRKITYGALFDNIDRTANAFHHIGLKQGDTVACIAPSFPETIYSFYAVNKLGGISDYFDPRMEISDIQSELQEVRPVAVLIYEDFIPKFQIMIDTLRIAHVIVLSAKDSLSVPLRLLMSLKNKAAIPVGWNNFAAFLKEGSQEVTTKTVRNAAHLPALMEHTGGTTGTPKAVVLTNQNVNAVAQQFALGSPLHPRGEAWLCMAFPFTAYTIVCSTHDPLVYGMALYLCFSVETDALAKMVIKNRVRHMANTPVAWEEMIHHPLAQNTDFSFLVSPIVGADALSLEKEKAINAFLQEHHCKQHISKGYGMTEVGSAAAITFSNECNKLGSVGIPYVYNTISVFDAETGAELKYDEQGEICITGPSVMKGYFNRPEETAAIIRTHADGKRWIHSGDIGHMDEDGFLYIDGRLKRMIVNHHGFKIFAPEVEAVLSQYGKIEKCSVVGAPDRDYNSGQIAVAFVIPKQGCKPDEGEMRKLCEEKLADFRVPGKFIVVDEFPYTSAAKVDYRKLEELAAEME